MNVEQLFKEMVPVVLGVLLAGWIMGQFSSSITLVQQSQAGFTGQ